MTQKTPLRSGLPSTRHGRGGGGARRRPLDERHVSRRRWSRGRPARVLHRAGVRHLRSRVRRGGHQRQVALAHPERVARPERGRLAGSVGSPGRVRRGALCARPRNDRRGKRQRWGHEPRRARTRARGHPPHFRCALLVVDHRTQTPGPRARPRRVRRGGHGARAHRREGRAHRRADAGVFDVLVEGGVPRGVGAGFRRREETEKAPGVGGSVARMFLQPHVRPHRDVAVERPGRGRRVARAQRLRLAVRVERARLATAAIRGRRRGGGAVARAPRARFFRAAAREPAREEARNNAHRAAVAALRGHEVPAARRQRARPGRERGGDGANRGRRAVARFATRRVGRRAIFAD